MNPDEQERLKALRRYGVLDTLPEEKLDRLTRLAAHLFDVPIALISFVDEARQWFKLCYGLDLRETPRATSFCTHAICSEEVFVVEDARQDPRFAGNPLVAGEIGIRFYAGAPIETPDGYVLGTFCVKDTRPRTFGLEERTLLKDLAAGVMDLLETQRALADSRETRQDLQERERLLSQAQCMARLGYWVWDIPTDRSAWSDEVYRIFGLEQGTDVSYDRFMACIDPEDRERVAALVEQARREGGPFDDQIRILRPDGTVRVLHGIGEVEVDSEGQAVKMFGVVQDVTEHRRAAEALEESEHRLRTIVTNTPVILFALDRQGIFTLSEGKGLATLGLRPGEVVGQSVFEVYRDVPEVLENVGRALSGEAFQSEVTIGDDVFEVCYNPVLDPEGHVQEVIGVAIDISELKRQKEELRKAKEQAEEMSRLKSAFLANMSHEIRTPLTTIIGFADVLSTQASGVEGNLLRLIRKGADRLMDTLNSVLELAQLESGSLTLKPSSFDVIERVHETIALLEERARDRGLTLTLKAPDEPVPVSMDRAALDRILQNLVSNAIKFTHEGEVTVTVHARREFVEIMVRDTGIGISEAFQAEMFEPFKQESEGLARHYEGSGIGLYITKQLVDMMDGTISVDSVRGRGSTFTVKLPRATTSVHSVEGSAGRSPFRETGAVTVREDADSPPHSSGTEAPAGRRCSVLLVEDNPANRELVRYQLMPACALDAASTGPEALSMLRATQYDAVLLDINLTGGMGGEEVLQALRAMPGGGDVPVVALTAHALPGDRERFLDLGFDGYLGKPFTRRQLRQALKLATALRKGRHAAAQRAASGRSSADELLDTCCKRGIIDRYEKTEGVVTLVAGGAHFRLSYRHAVDSLHAILEDA